MLAWYHTRGFARLVSGSRTEYSQGSHSPRRVDPVEITPDISILGLWIAVAGSHLVVRTLTRICCEPLDDSRTPRTVELFFDRTRYNYLPPCPQAIRGELPSSFNRGQWKAEVDPSDALVTFLGRLYQPKQSPTDIHSRIVVFAT
jgi:hypothetical protein